MAKAFIQGMKGIPANLEKHFENATNKVIEVIRDSHATVSDYKDAMDYVDQEFKSACQETGTTASDAARDEFEEHMLKGLSKEDAERWFEQKARGVKDLAEKARETVPKVEAAAKFVWLKFVVAVTVIFTGVVGFFYAKRGPTPELQATIDFLRRTEMEQQQLRQLSQMIISNAEFDTMTGSLFVHSAPMPVTSELPPAIAAVAAEPVEVEETTSAGQTLQTTTTVEHLYRSGPPEVRHQLESHPPPVFHVDHSEDMSDCFHTDCLKGIDKQFHREISVTNGDGSATISVSVPR